MTRVLSPTRREGALHFPLWVSIWVLLLQHALAQLTVSPINGQAFVDAITEFGNTGQDTVILLPQGQVLSLAGVAIKDVQLGGGRRPFSSGTLTIMPGPGNNTSPTVLDTAMVQCLGRHQDRCVAFSGTARLYVQDITLVNLCDMELFLDYSGTLRIYSALGIAFMVSSNVYQAFSFTRAVFYIRHADLTTYLGGLVALQAPFPQVLGRVQVPNVGGASHGQALAITPYSVALSSSSFPGILHQNNTLRSIADPGDPLLQSMRATGRLMAPKTCMDPLTLPTGNVTQPMMLNPQVPLWTTSDGLSWLNALSQATTQTYLGSILGIPKMVQLCGTATLAGVLLPPPIRPLTQTMVLAGCGSTNTTLLTEGVLDLSNTRTIMPVAASGQVLMQNMRLLNLPTQPLPSSGSPSVFPLAAFPVLNTATNNSNLIQMFNMTLELPELDYLALATLAVPPLASAVNAAVQAHAAALKTGLNSLLFSAAPQSLTRLTAITFSGWGLNATFLNLVPGDPEAAYALSQARSGPLGTMPAFGAQAARSPACSRLTVIILATVAGVMTVVAVGALGLVYTMRRKNRSACASASASIPSVPRSDLYCQNRHGAPEKQEDRPTAYKQTAVTIIDVVAATGHPDLPEAQPSQLEAKDVQQLQSFCEEVAAVTATAPPSQSRHGPVGSETGRHHVAIAFKRQIQQKATFEGSQPAKKPAHSEQSGACALSNVSDESSAACSQCRTPTVLTEAVDKISRVSDDSITNQVLVTGILGQGGGGTVYSGTWRGLEVALKTMLFEIQDCELDTEAGRARKPGQQALAEVAVAVCVDHPNVVLTYHYEFQPVTSAHGRAALGLQIEATEQQVAQTKVYKLFLIQERCRTSLAHLLSQRSLHNGFGRPKQVGVITEMLLDIAKGLEYLHSRSIVHGDLKPGNILIADGNASTKHVVAKLADFGLSARMAVGATHVSNYHNGTPFYVAPEVVHHCRTSPASDMYSFGITMWQLYTGDAPYVQPDKGPYMANPLFPRFDPGNPPPPAYTALLHQCLRRDPKQRPSASAVVTHLETLRAQPLQES